MTRQPWDDVSDRVRVVKSAEYVYPFRPTAAEVDAAEAALASDFTDENYRHFLDIKEQLGLAETAEALIEGFGQMSGRT